MAPPLPSLPAPPEEGPLIPWLRELTGFTGNMSVLGALLAQEDARRLCERLRGETDLPQSARAVALAHHKTTWAEAVLALSACRHIPETRWGGRTIRTSVSVGFNMWETVTHLRVSPSGPWWAPWRFPRRALVQLTQWPYPTLPATHRSPGWTTWWRYLQQAGPVRTYKISEALEGALIGNPQHPAALHLADLAIASLDTIPPATPAASPSRSPTTRTGYTLLAWAWLSCPKRYAAWLRLRFDAPFASLRPREDGWSQDVLSAIDRLTPLMSSHHHPAPEEASRWLGHPVPWVAERGLRALTPDPSLGKASL